MADDSMKFSDLGADAPEVPVDVDDSNIEEFVGRFNVAVIDCWAPWCGPCKMIAPSIHELAGEMKGQVSFGKLNTDENPKTAMTHRIMSIPTLLIFKDGKYVDRIIGASPKHALAEQLQKFL